MILLHGGRWTKPKINSRNYLIYFLLRLNLCQWSLKILYMEDVNNFKIILCNNFANVRNSEFLQNCWRYLYLFSLLTLLKKSLIKSLSCLCVCLWVPLIPGSRNRGTLCVCMCILPIIARQKRGKQIVVRVVFYAVRVASKESRRLLIPRTCFFINLLCFWGLWEHFVFHVTVWFFSPSGLKQLTDIHKT
jgi:hypothetical protein